MILLVSGSLRAGSTNTAALRTAAELAADALLYEGLASLPHFNPDDDADPLPPAVADLRAQIAAASAILFCTPEYAGALPGSFKNLLDWTVGGGEIYEKPVGWVNVAAEGRGRGAHDELGVVLGYVGANLIRDACVDAPLRRDEIEDGLVMSPSVRARIQLALAALRRSAAVSQ